MEKLKKLNIMAIGAHPDDCDICFGGTALKFKAMGHRVMFLSMTNGCSGHHLMPGPALSARRYAETQAVMKMTGIEYKVTDIPDGTLTADLRNRDLLLREIRTFKPDLILTHRPNDYHPDHRSTATLVMDSSYLILVPHVLPDSPPIRKRPYIFYFYDHFSFPGPFVPDIIVSIDDVIDQKIAMIDCHKSQMYEWIPWVEGFAEDVPPEQDEDGRRQWLKQYIRSNWEPPISKQYRKILEMRYGTEKSGKTLDCEAFQLSEYCAQAGQEELEKIFPL